MEGFWSEKYFPIRYAGFVSFLVSFVSTPPAQLTQVTSRFCPRRNPPPFSRSSFPPFTDNDLTPNCSEVDVFRHMGRCIYGGIYDPGNSLSNSDGFRLDVLEALEELNCPVMRYPGGNFVATYHWIDGVGPKDQRPSRPELAWLGTETNQFGTDEFMKWLNQLGQRGQKVEPYIALNFGTGTLDEALAWVEYCNGKGNTFYANLRRKHGREEPYGVKYWALGNEVG